MFGNCYRGKRVLVTGHTGFKGSWLALWLKTLGAEVSGISLAPSTRPSHWDLLSLPVTDLRLDLRDASALAAAVQELRPQMVFHLAAQSLVRPSYADPLGTWSTNVMGTAHLLEACRYTPDLQAIVVVTSDKCYENGETQAPYRESDALGGHDPYSASKGAAELVAASYRRAFFAHAGAPGLATARAGNVIGGGDWSTDRLVPDLVRAREAGRSLEIRSPQSVRPWQYVLESLSGYLVLAQRLLEQDPLAASAWNFGPDAQDACTVESLLTRLQSHWPSLAWHVGVAPQPHEAGLLRLDSSKAQEHLAWRPVWQLEQALASTARWYQAFLEEDRVSSETDLQDYLAAASRAGRPWAQS